MKKLITLFLIASQVCWAGLPPPTVQGQSGSKATTFNIQVPYNQATAQSGPTALIETGNKNLLVNPSMESQTAGSGYTIGSGLTATIDSTNYHDGKQSMLITATGGSFLGTIAYQSITPGTQLYPGNGEASFWVKTSLSGLTVCPTTGATPTILTTQCVTVPSTNQWFNGITNFTWPSSGASGVALYGAMSSSSTVNVDEGYLGEARNIGTVQQALAYGSAIYPATASCNWTTTASSYSNFAAVSACPIPTLTGNATAPSTKIPGITFTSLPAGQYHVVASGFFTPANNGTAATQGFQLSDGTNVSGVGNAGETGSSGYYASPVIDGWFTYTTPQSNLTWQIQAQTSTTGNAATITNGASGSYNTSLQFQVYYFPTSAQGTLSTNSTPANWSGTSTLSGTTTSATIADPGSVSGAITTTYSQSISCVAASSLVGITCTLPSTGFYHVCVSGIVNHSVANGSVDTLIADGSNSLITGLQNYQEYTTGSGGSFGACGNYNATSTTETFKVRAETNQATATVNPTTFLVISLNTPVAAPMIINSPGNYYAQVYYPASGSNYWDNTNTSLGNFVADGTIPTPTVQVNSNMGTISKATSSLPGVSLTAPRTGTIRVTARAYAYGSASNTWELQLQETSTSTTLDTAGSGTNASTVTNPTFLIGYISVTAGTSYNFNILGQVNTGHVYIANGNFSNLMFLMEYIN